jgi:gluconate kinase
MGAASSGKSTIGSALSKHLGSRFEDWDTLHPARNIANMRAGYALIAGRLALEPPTPDEKPILTSIDAPIAAIVDHIVTALSLDPASMAAPG